MKANLDEKNEVLMIWNLFNWKSNFLKFKLMEKCWTQTTKKLGNQSYEVAAHTRLIWAVAFLAF